MARQEKLRNRSRKWIGDLMRRLNAEQRRQIYAYAGSSLDFSKVPDSVWQNFERKIEEEFRNVLIIVYLLAYQEAERSVPIDTRGYDVDDRGERLAEQFANARAKKFARDYVENTTRWMSELPRDATSSEATRVFYRSLGEDRVATVAMTEGNLAIGQGEVGYADTVDVAVPGVKLVGVWKHHEHRPPGHSRAAVNPCPVCSPLEGLRQPDWPAKYPTGPPAHPKCDCHMEWELIPTTYRPDEPSNN